jgi:hypothetical protein
MAHFYDDTITDTGATAAIDWPGGPGVFGTQGDFSNLTVTLQFSIDGSTWTTVPGPNFVHTDDNLGAFQLCPCQLRLNVTGTSVGTPSIKARIAPAWQGYALDSLVF